MLNTGSRAVPVPVLRVMIHRELAAGPGGVGELDADDMDAVADLVDHGADRLGNLLEAVRPRRDDTDFPDWGAAKDRLPFTTGFSVRSEMPPGRQGIGRSEALRMFA